MRTASEIWAVLGEMLKDAVWLNRKPTRGLTSGGARDAYDPGMLLVAADFCEEGGLEGAGQCLRWMATTRSVPHQYCGDSYSQAWWWHGEDSEHFSNRLPRRVSASCCVEGSGSHTILNGDTPAEVTLKLCEAWQLLTDELGRLLTEEEMRT